ncbi:conserved hypothetical protein [Neospora caninum Liverpool]|uniref:Uncharacterized protein n=1 Tax=Neospora caninum (strain Liverpool) TaxID=572307 RepID=F0VGH2_NEOCL|nr:conserved hypothetical protein [Neospora caninum Liverpool]CBZ52816.1 conserved hypothetical protein [Neospora caninum Liverpool]|eukprot:XP_003882848.1 conserved hypothetical protein [Neospora caninum Liverpool]
MRYQVAVWKDTLVARASKDKAEDFSEKPASAASAGAIPQWLRDAVREAGKKADAGRDRGDHGEDDEDKDNAGDLLTPSAPSEAGDSPNAPGGDASSLSAALPLSEGRPFGEASPSGSPSPDLPPLEVQVKQAVTEILSAVTDDVLREVAREAISNYRRKQRITGKTSIGLKLHVGGSGGSASIFSGTEPGLDTVKGGASFEDGEGASEQKLSGRLSTGRVGDGANAGRPRDTRRDSKTGGKRGKNEKEASRGDEGDSDSDTMEDDQLFSLQPVSGPYRPPAIATPPPAGLVQVFIYEHGREIGRVPFEASHLIWGSSGKQANIRDRHSSVAGQHCSVFFAVKQLHQQGGCFFFCPLAGDALLVPNAKVPFLASNLAKGDKRGKGRGAKRSSAEDFSAWKPAEGDGVRVKAGDERVALMDHRSCFMLGDSSSRLYFIDVTDLPTKLRKAEEKGKKPELDRSRNRGRSRSRGRHSRRRSSVDSSLSGSERSSRTRSSARSSVIPDSRSSKSRSFVSSKGRDASRSRGSSEESRSSSRRSSRDSRDRRSSRAGSSQSGRSARSRRGGSSGREESERRGKSRSQVSGRGASDEETEEASANRRAANSLLSISRKQKAEGRAAERGSEKRRGSEDDSGKSDSGRSASESRSPSRASSRGSARSSSEERSRGSGKAKRDGKGSRRESVSSDASSASERTRQEEREEEMSASEKRDSEESGSEERGRRVGTAETRGGRFSRQSSLRATDEKKRKRKTQDEGERKRRRSKDDEETEGERKHRKMDGHEKDRKAQVKKKHGSDETEKKRGGSEKEKHGKKESKKEDKHKRSASHAESSRKRNTDEKEDKKQKSKTHEKDKSEKRTRGEKEEKEKKDSKKGSVKESSRKDDKKSRR